MSTADRSQPPLPSRRAFVALGVGALAVAAVPVVRRRRLLAQRTVPLMGTLADLSVTHRDVRYAQAAIDAAIERMRQVERVMTRFDRSSDVGRTNAAGAAEAVWITSATATVLRAALDWAETTDGQFDPCLGSAIELWDVGYRTAPPSMLAVERLAGAQLYRALDVDRWRGRPAARLREPSARLDLGGIAKGFGVDEAIAVLREWGITSALVNLGGDLRALGGAADGAPWRVGIRSPDRADRLVTTFELEDAAVATSGDYLQYFEYHGRRYHHLLNPATAAPRVTAMRSITVRADDCMTADAAATACFGTSPVVAAEWLGPRSVEIVHTVG